MKHEIKSESEYFQPVWVGVKFFEIRQNDRDYKPFDEVVLQEWDSIDREYTGREIEGYIVYFTDFHQHAGWCVFQLHITRRSGD